MKLFTIGPVEMYERSLTIGGEQVPYFRNEEFSNIMLETKQGLLKLADARNNDDIVFLTASGTAAMEATILNCFDQNDMLLIVNGGTFGDRFAQICKMHHIPYQDIKLSEGEVLTSELVNEVINSSNNKFTGLLVNAHESSTGQLYDLKMLSDICNKNNMIYVVDAISSFLADKISVSKLNIDVLILSSQKGLSLAPGLAMVILSDKIINERVNVLECKCFYLDFKSHLSNGKRGQTPFTPAIRIIYELNDIIKMILDFGVDKYQHQIENIALDFRNKAKAIGLLIPELPKSNAATTLIFPSGGAKKVHDELKNNYGIVVNPNGGKDADLKFRVGHIGNHSIEENEMFISAIKNILDK